MQAIMLDSYKFSHRISFNVKWIKRKDKLTNKLQGCFFFSNGQSKTTKFNEIYTYRENGVIWSTWFRFNSVRFVFFILLGLCYSHFGSTIHFSALAQRNIFLVIFNSFGAVQTVPFGMVYYSFKFTESVKIASHLFHDRLVWYLLCVCSRVRTPVCVYFSGMDTYVLCVSRPFHFQVNWYYQWTFVCNFCYGHYFHPFIGDFLLPQMYAQYV